MYSDILKPAKNQNQSTLAVSFGKGGNLHGGKRKKPSDISKKANRKKRKRLEDSDDPDDDDYKE